MSTSILMPQTTPPNREALWSRLRGGASSETQHKQDKLTLISLSKNPTELHNFAIEGLALDNPWMVYQVVLNNKTQENTLSMVHSQINHFKGQTMLHQNGGIQYKDFQVVILDSISEHPNAPAYLKTASKELSSATAKRFKVNVPVPLRTEEVI